jgi:adenine C2-methylase RlmN of 23S rRNA A2503 and tRNA A37
MKLPRSQTPKKPVLLLVHVREIVEQVRFVRQSLPPGARVRGVVSKGMGEPLANVEAVTQAILVLLHPTCQSIDQKAMTLCTCGIARGIDRVRAT